MPIVLEQPRLLHRSLSLLPTSINASLMAVVATLNAPPDQPNLPVVLGNLLRCIRAMLVRAPLAEYSMEYLLSDLAVAQDGLVGAISLIQPASMLRRLETHRQWALLCMNFAQAPVGLLEAIGIEFSRAYLTESRFVKRRAVDLYRMNERNQYRPLGAKDLDWLDTSVLAHLNRQRHVLTDRASGLDQTTASFNSQVIATLAARGSSMRVEERQAAGRLNELPAIQVIEIARNLRLQVEAGNPELLLTALAFCIGLSWELVKRVPFFKGRISASVIWIHPTEQCLYVNMERLFAGFSRKNTNRHAPSTLTLVLPLPTFVGTALSRALASNPGVEDVGSLAGTTGLASRSPVPGVEFKAAIVASMSRFIASAPAAALRAGLQRDVACLVTLAMALVSQSDHHYLIHDRRELWQGRERLFSSIGWGDCVPDPDDTGVAFGSRVTPEMAWVKALVAEHAALAAAARPSKRYSLLALIKHHNAFTGYVSLLLTTLAGGRNRKIASFFADIWREDGSFAIQDDKRVGPTLGMTPLPIPARSAKQIELLRCHIAGLDRRFDKLGLASDHPARQRIQSVLGRDHVNMIFLLDPDGLPIDLPTRSLFDGEGQGLNHDFSRHFMPGRLAQEGIPFEWIGQWLRHHLDGVSSSSITSTAVQSVWLSEVAQALDRIALELGLDPQAGISRSMP